MPVLDVIANRLLESSMKGDLKAIQWVDQSDQEATANEMAKHGEAEDIGLPNKEALSLLGERKTSSQGTSSASVIPFRDELSMTARNYGKDIPELREGHLGIMGRTSRHYDHDTLKLTARRAPYCAPCSVGKLRFAARIAGNTLGKGLAARLLFTRNIKHLRAVG
jgi:hypothetical protein